MISLTQKKTAQAIVNIFETGKPSGDYGAVTVLKNDPGHLTYGRSQTTLASGNLARLLGAYCQTGGTHADALKPWLPAFAAKDLALDSNLDVHRLLRQASADPMMRDVQDDFFDKAFWQPAERTAAKLAVETPLGVAVIYDSTVHGSFQLIRRRTDTQFAPCSDIGERTWIKNYVALRHQWLSNHRNPLLQRTRYRTAAFAELADKDNWSLQLPLMIRGIELTEATFNPQRTLQLTQPRMTGDDIRHLQQRLGFQPAEQDGVFGPKTEAAVRTFQRQHNLPVDGKVGAESVRPIRSDG